MWNPIRSLKRSVMKMGDSPPDAFGSGFVNDCLAAA